MQPPLVTSLREGSRQTIAAACPHALALGLMPGMALAQARVLVRGLDIRPADPEGDLASLHGLAITFARHYSPIVAIEGSDTIFLETTGTDHLFGGEARMARRIVRLLARLGFTARIAIADTPGAAWALAHHARDPVTLCPPGGHAEAIAGLPTASLRIESAQVELLRRFGIERVGQLAEIPRAPLVKRFGATIATRINRALGTLPEPLHPVIPPLHIATARRFAEPILTEDAIAHWLGQLVPELAEALAQAGLGALRLEFVADRIDGVPQRIRLGLARPNRDPAHLLRLLKRRIEDVEPGFGIDSIALHVRRSGPLGPEPFVERLDEEAAPDLAPLVDTLATRIGLDRLWRMRAVESDVPERSAARGPVLDPPERPGARLKPGDVRHLSRNPMLEPWHPHWPKPARLLRRPERIDHVLAELPDHAPRRFTWRGATHRIVRADGPERVHGEWWKRRSETHSVRDYFRVEDDEGHRYWLFRKGDGERGVTGDLSWYLHGIFG
ncbi:DNA polymerase Y family protein [Sphingomonas sp. AOB5]|uniref:Y-family DNA polymerase n=1 Tax=Sphingomonas sp. AOB5 TaxID=3034017 RepID=UPI0023F8DE1A|nr:DNA polymerase Y family protein [Sphingomonas sp. AOB5]MDF7776198.1 DNA polymerase Y family protein [Sphingomonas sp. AOB5]